MLIWLQQNKELHPPCLPQCTKYLSDCILASVMAGWLKRNFGVEFVAFSYRLNHKITCSTERRGVADAPGTPGYLNQNSTIRGGALLAGTSREMRQVAWPFLSPGSFPAWFAQASAGCV